MSWFALAPALLTGATRRACSFAQLATQERPVEKAQSVVVGEDGDKDFEASPSVAGTAEEYDASTSRATSEQQSHGSEGTAPELSGYLFKAAAGDNWQQHLSGLDPASQQALLQADEEEAGESDEDNDLDDTQSWTAQDGTTESQEPAPPMQGRGHQALARSMSCPASPPGCPAPAQLACQSAEALAVEAPQMTSLLGPLSPPGGISAAAEAAALPPIVSLPSSDATGTAGQHAQQAIWQRTRARQPMNAVSLDELSAMLHVDDEVELFPGEEEDEQYQEFLKALRGEQAELPEDDLEDVDFELDWSELLAEARDDAEDKQPRTRAQHKRHARELESTARIRDGLLRPLLPSQSAPAPLQPSTAFQQHQRLTGWTHAQMAQVHRQAHAHVQLLVQGAALARLMSPAASVAIKQMPCARDVNLYSQQARSLLHAFQAFSQQQAIKNWSAHVRLPLLPEPVAGCRAQPNECLYSVSQVAPLPLVADFLVDLDADCGAPQNGTSAASALMHLVEQALERFSAVFDAQMYPRLRVLGETEAWTPGEDELLAAGLLRFGMDFDRIRTYMLPSKSTLDIDRHQKSRSKKEAVNNCVKSAKAKIMGPLSPEELTIIERGLEFARNMQGKWEYISRAMLPHRYSANLPRLYHAACDARDAAILRRSSDASALTRCSTSHGQPMLPRTAKRRGRPNKQGLAARQAVATQQRLAIQQPQQQQQQQQARGGRSSAIPVERSAAQPTSLPSTGCAPLPAAPAPAPAHPSLPLHQAGTGPHAQGSALPCLVQPHQDGSSQQLGYSQANHPPAVEHAEGDYHGWQGSEGADGDMHADAPAAHNHGSPVFAPPPASPSTSTVSLQHTPDEGAADQDPEHLGHAVEDAGLHDRTPQPVHHFGDLAGWAHEAPTDDAAGLQHMPADGLYAGVSALAQQLPARGRDREGPKRGMAPSQSMEFDQVELGDDSDSDTGPSTNTRAGPALSSVLQGSRSTDLPHAQPTPRTHVPMQAQQGPAMRGTPKQPTRQYLNAQFDVVHLDEEGEELLGTEGPAPRQQGPLRRSPRLGAQQHIGHKRPRSQPDEGEQLPVPAAPCFRQAPQKAAPVHTGQARDRPATVGGHVTNGAAHAAAERQEPHAAPPTSADSHAEQRAQPTRGQNDASPQPLQPAFLHSPTASPLPTRHPAQHQPQVWDRADLSDDDSEAGHAGSPPPPQASAAREGGTPAASQRSPSRPACDQPAAPDLWRSPGRSEALARIYRASVRPSAGPPGNPPAGFERVDLSESDDDAPAARSPAPAHVPASAPSSEGAHAPAALCFPHAQVHSSGPAHPQQSAAGTASAGDAGARLPQLPDSPHDLSMPQAAAVLPQHVGAGVPTSLAHPQPSLSERHHFGHLAQAAPGQCTTPHDDVMEAPVHDAEVLPSTNQDDALAGTASVWRPWSKAEDMAVFKATIMGASGRPSPRDFCALSRQLQAHLPLEEHASRSPQEVRARFSILNACFQQHRSRQTA